MYARLPWHDATVEQIVGLADSERLPSAVALSCDEGWGGESLLARCAAELLGITSGLPHTKWLIRIFAGCARMALSSKSMRSES